MSTRIGVAIMSIALVLYLIISLNWAVALLRTGTGLAIAMGVALLMLPVVAGWALGRELWFGFRAEKIGRRLEAEGGLPDDEVSVRESGRVLREDADAVFPRYREDVQAHPDDWRAWYRLGLAYDASGDRRRAREAVRKAIRLEHAAPAS
jgi:cytochrome c-type biogenesis protein CcmH/NrfG